MCYGGEPHDLLDIYSIDVGWNEERTVWWCTKCGAVRIAKTSDNRVFGYVGKTQVPKYVRYPKVQEIISKKRG